MKEIFLHTETKENLLEVLQREGEYVPAFCGGNGTCGKCRVQFMSQPPAPSQKEREMLSEEEIAAGWRLACETDIKGTTHLAVMGFDKENTMEAEAGFYFPYEHLPDKEISRTGPASLVAAIDIGTTTLAASLVDTKTQSVVKTMTAVNHQRLFGADVVTRMEASNQGKGPLLQQYILEDIDSLLQRLDVPSDIPLVIAGNTTMEHLLQGFPCTGLGVAPYTPVDISLHQYGSMTILPGISTFVGADIVSGILALGMDQSDDINLLVDLGTNGEMVLGNQKKMIATSTAAGPAFEGGNISCGMAGIAGAIASVDIAEGKTRIKTIGNQTPVGLCGTGVLEMTHELLKEGLIDECGNPEDGFSEQGYILAPGVSFSVKDVREVQLAKAAVRAGIEVMLREYGADYEDLSHVYLAGGFGQKVNIKKAVGIGLLPEEFLNKVTAVGNSSLAGAVMFAKNPALAQRFQAAARNTEEVALAENPFFNEMYMEYMFF